MDQEKDKLWVYSKPNQMEGHEYTDDVAITWAKTKTEALEKFRRLYDLSQEDVQEVWFNGFGVAILTDY